MYDDLIKRLQDFAAGTMRDEDAQLAFDAADAIEKLQADVRPVVRGKWVQTGGKYSRHKTIDRRILTCSVCGNLLSMEGVNAGRGDANFCPNCGADMREPPKEET